MTNRKLGFLAAGASARSRRAGRTSWGRATRLVLPNGLCVITAPTPGLHSSMIALYVRTGSRYETEGTSGVSHFLEHLFFRGSTGYPDTVAMNAAIEIAGGSLNGITTRDHGCYYTAIHPAEMSTGIAILGDMIRRPLLCQIDLEREVILEEILDEVDSRGRDIDADNLAKRLVFGRHPLGLKIAGTAKSVRSLSEATIRQHHSRFYCGSNLVLVVAGPVESADVVALAREHLGAIPRGTPSKHLPASRWPRGPLLELLEHDEAQSELCFNFPCPPERHSDYPVLLCIRRLLDDGLSSRLPYEIVEKRGLAYALHAGMDTFSDCGIVVINGACSPKKVPALAKEILRVLAELGSRKVSGEELLRVQQRHRMTLAFSLDNAADVAGWYGSGEVLQAPEGFEERCQRVERVTPTDVQRVARGIFTKRHLAAVLVGPGCSRLRRRIEKIVETAGLGP